MNSGELIYEGKGKRIFSTERDDEVIMSYKDEATAFDGAKKGIIKDKGVINNRISALIYTFLARHGIPTHLVKTLDERNVVVKRLEMIPVEVVVRNLIAGGLAKRLGREEGEALSSPVVELYYKSDALHDPMISESLAVAMGWASEEQLQDMKAQALRINQVLQSFFDGIGIILVDFKLEFGLYQGRLILGDEITPDGCRLWDKISLEKMDKDRFRRDLGGEEEAYQEVVRRIEAALPG
jgi:phosphoribosylaminoimidazole-succinocarboxamide synthase